MLCLPVAEAQQAGVAGGVGQIMFSYLLDPTQL